jgi:hypothetical protein
MRSAGAVFLGVFAAGLVAILLVGLSDKRVEAFTLGVVPGSGIAQLQAGDTLCQRPIEVEETFSWLRLVVSSPQPPGPPLLVEVRDTGGRVLGHAGVRGGYGKAPTNVVAPVGRVDKGRRVAVCVRHQGSKRTTAVLYGGVAVAAAGSDASLDGHGLGQDLSVVFLRDSEPTLLSLAGDVVDRASLWHGEWIHPWLLWLVVALLVLALPALLALALRSVADQPTAAERE